MYTRICTNTTIVSGTRPSYGSERNSDSIRDDAAHNTEDTTYTKTRWDPGPAVTNRVSCPRVGLPRKNADRGPVSVGIGPDGVLTVKPFRNHNDRRDTVTVENDKQTRTFPKSR